MKKESILISQKVEAENSSRREHPYFGEADGAEASELRAVALRVIALRVINSYIPKHKPLREKTLAEPANRAEG